MTDEKQHAQAWWILAAVALVLFMVNIDFTAVNVALLTMAQDLHAGLSTIQWTISGYVLCMAMFVVPAGRCADMFGRRRLFIIGLIIFTAASLLTGFADQVWLAIVGRILQGFGAALFVPCLYALVFLSFPRERYGFAIGLVGVAVGLGLALGPTIGGLVLNVLSWRWLFFINLPFAALVLFVLMKVTVSEPDLSNQKINYPAVALLALAIFSFMFAFQQVHLWGFDSWHFWQYIIASTIICGAFVWVQAKTKLSLVPLQLLKNRPFVGCILTTCLQQFAFASSVILISLYLQIAMGYSVMATGIIFLAMTLVFGLLSPLGGHLADRVDIRLPIITGFVLLFIAFGVFSLFGAGMHLWQIIVNLLIVGLGLGLSFSALNTAILTSVSAEEVSVASGVFAMFALLGNTLGVILNASLLLLFGRTLWLHWLQFRHIPLSTALQNKLLNGFFSLQAHVTLPQLPADLNKQINSYVPHLVSAALHDVLLVDAVLMLLAIMISWLLIRMRVKLTQPAQTA